MLFIRSFLVALLLLSTQLVASIGSVSLLKGEAFVYRASQTIALSNGMAIEAKDTIKTAKEAQIQLIFEDKTVISLGSESDFSIEEYLNDASSPKAKFKFNQGSFKTITGKIGKIAPENFTLETKTATIGIRGTIVKGQTGDAGDTIACLRGLITVMSRQTGAMVEVRAGQFTTVSPTQDPAAPQETTLGSTDAPLAQNASGTSPETVGDMEQANNNQQSNNLYTSSTDSQYVSWGIWGGENHGPSLIVNGEYWVGGSTLTPENTINNLITQEATYTYTGKVLGKTSIGNDWENINSATSDVKLIFNFGGQPSIDESSYIKFSNSGATQNWVLTPENSHVLLSGFNSSFKSDTNGGNVNITSGTMNGKYYGSDAQAIGGQFNVVGTSGIDEASQVPVTAVGVFKAAR